jgi:DNA replication protein DnaC
MRPYVFVVRNPLIEVLMLQIWNGNPGESDSPSMENPRICFDCAAISEAGFYHYQKARKEDVSTSSLIPLCDLCFHARASENEFLYEEAHKRRTRRINSMIPEKWWHLSLLKELWPRLVLDPSNLEAVAMLRRVVNGRRYSLFVTGPVGSGKTLLGRAAACDVLRYEPDLQVRFTSEIELVRLAYLRLEAPQEANAILHDIYCAPFLVIDDLGRHRLTDFLRELLFALFNVRADRNSHNLRTVLLSHLSQKEVEEWLENGAGPGLKGALSSRFRRLVGRTVAQLPPPTRDPDAPFDDATPANLRAF